jgi:hypothetical protein
VLSECRREGCRPTKWNVKAHSVGTSDQFKDVCILKSDDSLGHINRSPPGDLAGRCGLRLRGNVYSNGYHRQESAAG